MKGDGIIRKCPVCEKEVVGSKEAREHAIENNHYGVYLDKFNELGLSIG